MTTVYCASDDCANNTTGIGGNQCNLKWIELDKDNQCNQKQENTKETQ